MSIVAPIAGSYLATLNPAVVGGGAAALGYTRTGFQLNFTQKGERIEETDLFGLSLIDIVSRGAQMTVEAAFKVFSAVTRDAIFPWAGAFGRVYNAANPIGKLASGTVDALVFTVVAGTSAATGIGPTTLTAPSVKLSLDNATQLILNSTVREVPLRWDALLTESSGVSPQTGTLFTTT